MRHRAWIAQRRDGELKYVSFESRALTKSELNYPQTKLELLSVLSAVNRFWNHLLSRRFEQFPYYEAITNLISKKKPNKVIFSWFDILDEFDFTITHG